MKTKKQQIIKKVLAKVKHLASESLTDKQLNTLEKFMGSRLDTHGKYGYMFQSTAYYKKQLIPVDEVEIIAEYVIENNFIKTRG